MESIEKISLSICIIVIVGLSVLPSSAKAAEITRIGIAEFEVAQKLDVELDGAKAPREVASGEAGEKAELERNAPDEALAKKAAAEMVKIAAGSFLMGSPSGEGSDDERPQHEVSVDAFYIGKHEVTFEQYDIFCEKTGRSAPRDEGWGRGNRPVINVSWHDAVAFCDWLSVLSGDMYRLPTEAEWEYACRAGTSTKYSSGDSVGDGWLDGSSGGRTHPVGELRANAWGLYDMHGNVSEWLSDWYGEDYYGGSPSSNPKGPTSGEYRVFRGGGWYSDAGRLRSAYRSGLEPDDKDFSIGFRCARDE